MYLISGVWILPASLLQLGSEGLQVVGSQRRSHQSPFIFSDVVQPAHFFQELLLLDGTAPPIQHICRTEEHHSWQNKCLSGLRHFLQAGSGRLHLPPEALSASVSTLAGIATPKTAGKTYLWQLKSSEVNCGPPSSCHSEWTTAQTVAFFGCFCPEQPVVFQKWI